MAPPVGAVQADLLRDIFGEPWREPALVLSNSAALMAAEAYRSRDFSNLPVIADALEEAGCQDVALLGHLRNGKPHTRGCWAVEAVSASGSKCQHKRIIGAFRSKATKIVAQVNQRWV